MSRIFSLPTLPFFLTLFWGVLFLYGYHLTHPQDWLSAFFTLLPLSTWHQTLVMLLLLALTGWLLTYRSQRLRAQLEAQIIQHKQEIKALKKQFRGEEQQINTLLQGDLIAYWEWDIQNNQARFSPQWKKMVGLSEQTPLNNLHDLQKRIHPKDQEEVQRQMLKILSGNRPYFECTHRVKHEDGHYIWVHDKGQIFYSPQGDIERLSAIRLDVSKQKWIEDELELDAAIIDLSSEGIAVANADQQVVRCNHALAVSLGLDTNQLKTLTLEELLNRMQDEPNPKIFESLKNYSAWHGELTLHDPDGNLKLASIVHLQKIFHETSQRENYSLMQLDITDLKRTQQALDDLANKDTITGLANRNKLYQCLDHALTQGNPLCFFFLDLDGFKQVNDTLGHDIGDILLQQVARRLLALLNEHVMLARLGGDEFVLYFTPQAINLTDTELAQAIIQMLRQPFEIEGHTVQIGTSIGIARYPQDGAERQTLMKAADDAMYLAKRAGKGRYAEFDALAG
ncbi:sensor domain-containing diguanylate cyclase [Thiomicrorhabdus cannonii]|uniref:sensor domain-containing diguanylate cyclase n=1 Tax=Thiomicrorhabdus cannonii TaxID=2748011 RepID=UPI0015BB6220|nr:sensor domain-containing diguanylate cyclase [Thiomicrorhabdus cannonii]